MEELLKLLSEIRPDVDFATGERLMDDAILDSFDVVAIVGEIASAFDVRVPVEEIKNENFNSAQAMLDMINRLKK